MACTTAISNKYLRPIYLHQFYISLVKSFSENTASLAAFTCPFLCLVLDLSLYLCYFSKFTRFVAASFNKTNLNQQHPSAVVDSGFEMESVSRPKSLNIPNYGSDKNVDGKRCKTVGVVMLTVSHENYYLLMSKLS